MGFVRGLAFPIALAVVAPAGPLAAQRLDVYAANAQGPLAGAVVVVEDTAGRPVTRLLANAAGMRRIDVPPGRYRVRVLAIGHGPEASDPVSVRDGAVTVVRLVLVPRPLVIDEIVVRSRPACGGEVAGGAQLARLWDEARKNLETAALSRAAGGAMFEVVTFERELTTADVVVRERRDTRRAMAVQPFVAAAADIERGGYVQTAGDERTYYAPDEPLLLSDHFLTTHCFSVVHGSPDAELVGLRFDPAPGHRLPDIAGVLWMNRRTAEATLLEYGYANVRLPREARRVGGHIRFVRLPTGASVIADWIIRMPRLVTLESRRATRDSVAGYREVGGVTALDDRPLDTRRATVAGRVVDSIGWTGLPGVVVSVSDGAFADTTDESGAFRFGVPLEGNHRISFRHPRFDLLRLAPLDRAVALVRGEESQVAIHLPSARTTLDLVCPAESGADDRSVILGRVVDRLGASRSGVEMLATWVVVELRGPRVRTRPVEVTTTTGAEGGFSICAPLGRTVTVRAAAPASDSVVVSHRRDPVAFVTVTIPR